MLRNFFRCKVINKSLTGLSDYYEMMGTPIVNKNDMRTTYLNLDFREGVGKDGTACITFVDEVPVYLNWFIWDLDHEWMMTQVEKELGVKIKLSNYTGGNGHCGADIEIIK